MPAYRIRRRTSSRRFFLRTMGWAVRVPPYGPVFNCQLLLFYTAAQWGLIVASPIGHVVVGVGVAGALAGALGVSSALTLWAGVGVASCLRDLDLIPRLWGIPFRRTHRKVTHSVLALGPLVGFSWVAAHALGWPFQWQFLAAWTGCTAVPSGPRRSVHRTCSGQAGAWHLTLLASYTTALVRPRADVARG
jgi:hypothetical protein